MKFMPIGFEHPLSSKLCVARAEKGRMMLVGFLGLYPATSGNPKNGYHRPKAAVGSEVTHSVGLGADYLDGLGDGVNVKSLHRKAA